MTRISPLRNLAACSALAIMAAWVAPASGNDDEEQWAARSKARDDAIVKCILAGTNLAECSERKEYEFNPKFAPTNPQNLTLKDTTLYSLPALTGPSAADIFRQQWNQGMNHNPSTGSLSGL